MIYPAGNNFRDKSVKLIKKMTKNTLKQQKLKSWIVRKSIKASRGSYNKNVKKLQIKRLIQKEICWCLKNLIKRKPTQSK